MDRLSQIKKLLATDSEIPPKVIEDFIKRMDPDYFEQFGDQQVTEHLLLANQLTPDHPLRYPNRKNTGGIVSTHPGGL